MVINSEAIKMKKMQQKIQENYEGIVNYYKIKLNMAMRQSEN